MNRTFPHMTVYFTTLEEGGALSIASSKNDGTSMHHGDVMITVTLVITLAIGLMMMIMMMMMMMMMMMV